MRKKLKGGIETIIAVVILVGIVIALIISAVLPTVLEGQNLSEGAVNRLSELDGVIRPDDV